MLALISVAAETQSSVDMVFPTHLWHRCTLTWISSIKLLFYRRHFAVRWVWFIVQYCAAPYSLEQITKIWTTLKCPKVAVGENLRGFIRIYEFPHIVTMEEEANRPIKVCTVVGGLWLFSHALSFGNAERQSRKQHISFLPPPPKVNAAYVFIPVCLFVSTISEKVMDGFWRKLVERLRVWQGQADSILVHVWIEIRPISGIQNVISSA